MGASRATGEAAAESRPSKARPSSYAKWLAPTLTVVAVLVIWQVACTAGLVPSFLLPSPADVAGAIAEDFDLLMMHAGFTLVEALSGLAAGVAIGFAIALLMDRFRIVYQALNPLVTISQTIPTIAIAPLLVLWLGYGMLPKVLLVALTTFFPITVSLTQGFRSVDPDAINLMRTMDASWWQIFRFAKLPAATGQFFSGLRISATYAVVGAVVAEWLGGFSGLGVYMTRVRKSYAYDEMFAVIIIIAVLSLVLMGVVSLLQRACMPWEAARKKR